MAQCCRIAAAATTVHAVKQLRPSACCTAAASTFLALALPLSPGVLCYYGRKAPSTLWAHGWYLPRLTPSQRASHTDWATWWERVQKHGNKQNNSKHEFFFTLLPWIMDRILILDHFDLFRNFVSHFITVNVTTLTTKSWSWATSDTFTFQEAEQNCYSEVSIGICSPWTPVCHVFSLATICRGSQPVMASLPWWGRSLIDCETFSFCSPMPKSSLKEWLEQIIASILLWMSTFFCGYWHTSAPYTPWFTKPDATLRDLPTHKSSWWR